MYIKKLVNIILLFLLSTSLYAIEKYVDCDLIKKSSSPRFLPNGILFTLDENFGHNIYLRTNMDGWQKNYHFIKNLYGLWYLVLPYDLNKSEIIYKLNTDGFWETDPNNSEITSDKYGAELSVLSMPKDIIYYQNTPLINDGEEKMKKINFKYYNPYADEVNFVTSLDNWSQYSHSMTLNSDGYWEITINFRKGKYFYYFLVDGKKVVDMENENKNWISGFEEVSTVIIQ